MPAVYHDTLSDDEARVLAAQQRAECTHVLGVANDVGIITLPNNAGHVALAIFVKESTADTPAQEKTIAQVARAVYDYFLFR